MIDVHLVTQPREAAPSDLPDATSVVVDTERILHGRYGIRSECLYLIRSVPAAPRGLHEHLERIFVRRA